jgi:hypothetical protein
MQVRIVMEQDLSLDGILTIKYVPQYKGWFFWKNFESGCNVYTYDSASFDTYEKAKAFLNEYARLNGLHKSSVITEYIIE